MLSEPIFIFERITTVIMLVMFGAVAAESMRFPFSDRMRRFFFYGTYVMCIICILMIPFWIWYALNIPDDDISGKVIYFWLVKAWIFAIAARSTTPRRQLTTDQTLAISVQDEETINAN